MVRLQRRQTVEFQCVGSFLVEIGLIRKMVECIRLVHRVRVFDLGYTIYVDLFWRCAERKWMGIPDDNI